MLDDRAMRCLVAARRNPAWRRRIRTL